MLPNRLLQSALRGPRSTPRYLDESDHSWLRALIDEYTRFEGRRRGELDERLQEPLPVACPQGKQQQAVHVMNRLCHDRARAAVDPQQARAVLAREAARGGGRSAVLSRAGGILGVDGSVLVDCMLADLPCERLVGGIPGDLNAVQLGLRTNLAIAQGMVARAMRVLVYLAGNARDIVRHARLRGLLCTVCEAALRDGGVGTVLDISGPFSLFRHTLVYGRALAGLVPRLSWCDRFELRAQCLVEGEPRVLVIRSGDPIFPADEPRRYDSRLEEAFARDFSRAAPDWEVVREPEPVPVRGALIFPDFALVHRRQRDRKWLLEIVGFWTPEYLHGKLEMLRAAQIRNLILCVDERRNCSAGELPAAAKVVRYRRRIDPEGILRIVEPERP